MSYLLETLGRGLLGQLLNAFETQLPGSENDDLADLQTRRAQSPTSADVALRLGTACLRGLRLNDARAAFESALELSVTSSKPAIGLACVHDEWGRLDESLRYLAVAQARDPHDPAIAFGIAFCHERRGEAYAAQVNYQHALTLCPRLRNARERLAALAVRGGEWAKAIEQYEQLAELEPGDLDVLLTLANLYLQTGRAQDAIDGYQRALLIEPECGEGPLHRVEDLTSAGKLTEAIGTLEKLIAKYPGVAEFHVHLGDLYVRAEQDQTAVEQYRRALELQPNFLEATVKLGTQHLRCKRYVDAAQAFNRAVELNDRLMTAFIGLGVAQDAAGRAQEARATFDLAASMEPNSTLLFCEAARLHLKSQNKKQKGKLALPGETAPKKVGDDALLREALRRHRQALLATPQHADLHYRHGLLLRQAGEFELAIAAFRKAVEINPNYVKALLKLGICLKEIGQTEEAIETFRRTLTLGRNYVDAHYQLGLLFAQRNQFDLAVEQFELAAAGNPENLAFRQNLALALQNIGMVDRAAATWRSICELSHDPEDLTHGPRSAFQGTH